MHVFYTPGIDGSKVTLNEEESRHAIKVLRLKTGDRVQLIDGTGGSYIAKILDPLPKKTLLDIERSQRSENRRNYQLSIAIAPTKSMDRMEFFVEKVTELGIDTISLIRCERSERKIIKPERLRKVIIAAAKQSIKPHFPVLNEIQPFADFLKTPFGGQKFIAHCSSEKEAENLSKKCEAGKNSLILIGPEGDFTDQEVRLSNAEGFISISLGEERLRTETAGIAACHTINLINAST